jgi:hypothetical protein
MLCGAHAAFCFCSRVLCYAGRILFTGAATDPFATSFGKGDFHQNTLHYLGASLAQDQLVHLKYS